MKNVVGITFSIFRYVLKLKMHEFLTIYIVRKGGGKFEAGNKHLLSAGGEKVIFQRLNRNQNLNFQCRGDKK